LALEVESTATKELVSSLLFTFSLLILSKADITGQHFNYQEVLNSILNSKKFTLDEMNGRRFAARMNLREVPFRKQQEHGAPHFCASSTN
jgi:hypothetical protein